MIVDNHWLKYFTAASSEAKALKNSLENTIGLEFVDIGEKLERLAQAGDLAQVRRSVPAIQKQLFELYYLCVGDGLNLVEFCGQDEPGSQKTSVNLEAC